MKEKNIVNHIFEIQLKLNGTYLAMKRWAMNAIKGTA